MQTIRTFATSQDARDYRRQNGTGGWIFAPTCTNPEFYPWTESVLFPPEYTPTMIFNHPITKGRNGKLLAN